MVSACHIQWKQFHQTTALESYLLNRAGDVGKIGIEWQERNTLWTISELTPKQNRTPQTKTWILRQSPFSYSPLWQSLTSPGSLAVHGCGHVSPSSFSRVDGVSAEQGLKAPWPVSSQLCLGGDLRGLLFPIPPCSDSRRWRTSVKRRATLVLNYTAKAGVLRQQCLAGPLSVSGHSEGLWLGMLSREAWLPFELRLLGEVERLRKELSCWDLFGLPRWQKGERGSGHATSLRLLEMLRKNEKEKKKDPFHGSFISLAPIRKGVNQDLIKGLKFTLVKD